MKAYIVEDNDSMRFILKRLLRKNFSSITAIGESENAGDALRKIPSFAPDVVLVDLSLPGMDGIEMVERLKPQCPNIFMLVVTCHDIDLYKQTALNAGAHEVISKMDYDELLRAVGDLIGRSQNDICN